MKLGYETDYLIVGSGASGISFADTLVSETQSHITIVDRQHSPGGHWNSAYPFVRLHQPSAFYGVASQALGSNRIDTTGGNKGLHELASGREVLAYFQTVMDRKLLPSGRVRYLPNCELLENGSIRANITQETHQINVRKSIVHSSYGAGEVPALHRRKFEVDGDVDCLTPTEIAEKQQPFEQYAVLGSGKTGADVCLWLLDQGIHPSKIVWVMPRDAWWIDRRMFQPGSEFHEFKLKYALEENEAVIAAETLPDLFARLGHAGNLLQLDPDHTPTAYKCGTVTPAELDSLRKIETVIRLGHVTRLSRGKMTLKHGEIVVADDTVFIDCTATGIRKVASVPVFQPGHIFVQSVRTCQPTFSAAFIAHLETTIADDAQKNALSVPVPYPADDIDWIGQKMISLQNQFMWLQNKSIRDWLKSCRLDALTAGDRAPTETPELAQLSARFKDSLFPAMINLKKLNSMADAGEA